MKNPKISVVMPVYNAEKYLREAMEGVLSQSFSDFEFVIVNDGSRDGSAEIIRSFADPRIVFADHAENAGVVARLNEGLRLAGGEYVARIDSDDIWTDRDKLAKQAAFLDRNPEYGVLGTWADAISDGGKRLFTLSYPLSDAEIRPKILAKDYLVNCSVMFRRQAAIDVGAYDTDEKYAEDYSLWLRIGRKWKFANLPETTAAYRITPSGITQTSQIIHTQNSWQVVRKNREYYPGYALAWIKWNAKLLLLRIVGGKSLNAITLGMKR